MKNERCRISRRHLGSDRRASRCSRSAATATRGGALIALIGAARWVARHAPLWLHFDPRRPTCSSSNTADWIPRFDIHYHLGVDGISMLLVLLNSLMTLIVVWSAWEVIQVRVAQYMAAFLIQSGLINGAFSALDGILSTRSSKRC
jgi:NADH-quinone oxidoreductase subunit M